VIREQTVLVQKARGEEVRLQNNLEKKIQEDTLLHGQFYPKSQKVLSRTAKNM
jgi:hypothetical protein